MSDKFRHKTSGVHLTFQVVVLFKNVRIFLNFEQSYDERSRWCIFAALHSTKTTVVGYTLP